MWPVLSGLLASRPLRVALGLICVGFGCYLWGYARGSASEALRREISAGSALLDFQSAARRAEEAARVEQNRIAHEYQRQIEALQHEQEALQTRLADYELADAVRVPAVPSEPDRVQCPADPASSAGRVPADRRTGGGAVCYTEDQLRRKIAASVAIGQECDREMMRFMKLIEACRVRAR